MNCWALQKTRFWILWNFLSFGRLRLWDFQELWDPLIFRKTWICWYLENIHCFFTCKANALTVQCLQQTSKQVRRGSCQPTAERMWKGGYPLWRGRVGVPLSKHNISLRIDFSERLSLFLLRTALQIALRRACTPLKWSSACLAQQAQQTMVHRNLRARTVVHRFFKATASVFRPFSKRCIPSECRVKHRRGPSVWKKRGNWFWIFEV